MLAVLAYRTAAFLAGVLPARLADALASALARLAFSARVPARAVLERNLARVLPAAGARERRDCARTGFESFALAFARFLRTRREPSGDVAGREHLAAARRGGRGVIVLSAHLGDWERGAELLAAEGLVVHLAARAHASRTVERLFASRRAAAGVRVLPPDAIYAGAAAALRRGECVALMADRGAARSGGASVCAWAAALAKRTGAVVLPAVCVRGPEGRALLFMEAPLSPERCRDGAFRGTMRAWLGRWAGQWAAFEALPEGVA